MAEPIPLLRIAAVFTRYANLTFGGGSATIAVLHREIVATRKWIDETKFALCFALCRLTPGTNLLAFCAGVGWLVRRFPGAIIALLAASIPCSILVVIVTLFFEDWSHDPRAAVTIQGATAAAVGITVMTCWTIAKPYVRRTRWMLPALVVGVAFVLEVVFAVPPVRVLLGAAVVGALLPARKP
jgi:chromate transporter